MARPKILLEHLNLRLPAGSKQRMDALLDPDEVRMDFIRLAIERECQRRERTGRRSPAKAEAA